MQSMDSAGLDVAREYYQQLVRPLLESRWPGLPHAAARLGGGSEVLGLDDAMSRDHDWGLRLTLLLDEEYVEPVDRFLDRALPDSFLGLPTRFATTHSRATRHRVEVRSPRSFAADRLGLDITGELSVLDWLSLTGQALAELTAGEVFADSAGELGRIRQTLSWYPHDVWLQVVAAGWSRLAEELPLVGRTGYRGDDAGSRIIAARLCATLMHLGFMLERRWPPYPKWLGTVFSALPSAGVAAGSLGRALAADTWQHRQEALAEAARQLWAVQRTTTLPHTDSDPVEPFYDRPFVTVRQAVIDTVRAGITDPAVLAIPTGLGAVEQWVDNVTVLVSPSRRRAAVRACLGEPDE